MKNLHKKPNTSRFIARLLCVQKFWEKLSLPSLSGADKPWCGRPITGEGISNKINSLHIRKSCGHDGYGPELKSSNIPSSIKTLFVEYRPRNLFKLLLILYIYKCSSQRPSAYMFLSKFTLDYRQKDYLLLLIRPDQTRFITSNQTWGLIISLWQWGSSHIDLPHLFTTTDIFGLRENFLHFIRVIYYSQRASLSVIDVKTSGFWDGEIYFIWRLEIRSSNRIVIKIYSVLNCRCMQMMVWWWLHQTEICLLDF